MSLEGLRCFVLLARTLPTMENIFDFISNTADGVLAVDREQKIVLWNEAAETLLGFKASEVLGKFCQEVIAGRDRRGHVVCRKTCPNTTMALQGEGVPIHELLVRTNAGQDVWLSVSTILIPSRWRNLCVLVHLFRDVSYHKELERSIQHLLSNLAKLTACRETDPHGNLPPPTPLMNLTGREREILRLLASGASNKTIATHLFICPATMRNHMHNLFAKLGVHSRLEAVTLAWKADLI